MLSALFLFFGTNHYLLAVSASPPRSCLWVVDFCPKKPTATANFPLIARIFDFRPKFQLFCLKGFQWDLEKEGDAGEAAPPQPLMEEEAVSHDDAAA